MVKSLERSTPDSSKVRKKVTILKYTLSIGLYKGLLSVEDVMTPFPCLGKVHCFNLILLDEELNKQKTSVDFTSQDMSSLND